jgi:hypothetical protein
MEHGRLRVPCQMMGGLAHNPRRPIMSTPAAYPPRTVSSRLREILEDPPSTTTTTAR